MALGEFDLIEKYFRACGALREDVRIGVGDDAAVLRCPPGHELVAAVDTLNEGVHFPPGSPAASIGHRALAVNLSDMAAMGARPAWILLSLALPRVDEAWLSEFSRGLGALAQRYGVALVGGDTTSGPLSISVQVLGFVPVSRAMLRSGAKPGDVLFVSGSPGDAAAGLMLEQSRLQVSDARNSNYLRERFLFPTPRLELGERLRDYASACIDISDGLLGDAGKLASASACGVQIDWNQLPVSTALIQAVGEEQARRLALTGGDDYELCFSVPRARVQEMEQALPPETWGYRRIGEMSQMPEARVVRDGIVMDFSHSGFDHFGAAS